MSTNYKIDRFVSSHKNKGTKELSAGFSRGWRSLSYICCSIL